ncbi:MAG: hypothetical protein HRT74_03925 [Flavobacteriales bacterium]|nr:hypothetical protein [Flavobacteriales bacterium]
MSSFDSTNRIQHYTVEVYRAPARRDYNAAYAKGHFDVLRKFNIPNLKSEETTWFEDEKTIVAIAINLKTNTVVGGGRVELRNTFSDLGISTVMEGLEPNFGDHLSHIDNLGEVKGLWTANDIEFKGLSVWIISALTTAYFSGTPDLFALCSPFSIKKFAQAGWKIYESVGEDGYYSYPTEKYRSAFMAKNTFTHQTPSERNLIRMNASEMSYMKTVNINGMIFILNYDFSQEIFQASKT